MRSRSFAANGDSTQVDSLARLGHEFQIEDGRDTCIPMGTGCPAEDADRISGGHAGMFSKK
jgi:hypothetical protein